MNTLPESIEHFMQRDFEMVNEEVTAVDAASQMARVRIGCLGIQREGSDSGYPLIVGLVSETDLVRQVLGAEQPEFTTTMVQLIGGQLRTIPSNRTMLDASHFMEQQGVRHLCVSEGEEIVGLISIRDLVRYFVYGESGPIRELDNVYRPLSVLMRTTIETIEGNETVHKAAQRMSEKRVGSLLVRNTGEDNGIITERDLIQKVLAEAQDPRKIQVNEVMTKPVIGIDINRTVYDASDLMAEKWIRHLPVTENDKIVGILSVRDLIRMVALRDRPRFLRQQGGQF